MQIRSIMTPIYRFGFSAFVFQTDEEINSAFPNADFEPIVSDFDGGVFVYEDKHYVCFRRSEITAGIVAHEAVHLAIIILQHIGWRVDGYNDEPLAYLVMWLVDELNKLF